MWLIYLKIHLNIVKKLIISNYIVFLGTILYLHLSFNFLKRFKGNSYYCYFTKVGSRSCLAESTLRSNYCLFHDSMFFFSQLYSGGIILLIGQ